MTRDYLLTLIALMVLRHVMAVVVATNLAIEKAVHRVRVSRTLPDVSHEADIPNNSKGIALRHHQHHQDGAPWAAPYASIHFLSAHLMVSHRFARLTVFCKDM